MIIAIGYPNIIRVVHLEGPVVKDQHFSNSQEGKERGVETQDMRSHKTILVVEARRHMVNNWNLSDLHIGGVKGI
jgi:hypothetical protein